jgi:glycosyltransferase involved in cell wall biosynthesis
MSKIKVCILQYGFARGGTDTFVINLCKSIDRDKFEITIVNPSILPENNTRESEITDLGIEVYHTCDMNTAKGKLVHLWKLYRFLRKRKFDTFHTNVDLFNGPQLLVARLTGIKNRVCHSHNTNQAAGVESQSLAIKLYQKVMKYLCKVSSTRRCGCSPEAMDFLFPFDWKDNSYPQIIYNGIDLQKFNCKVDIIAKKSELGLTAKNTILTIGNIHIQKNPLFIADIFAAYNSKCPDSELVWLGRGSMKEQVEDRLRQLGVLERVHFLGQRSDVAEIMKCADIFLLPSLFEGLGIVVIEAQASGLPCLVSDQVPHITDCGMVWYKPLHDSASNWAETISEIIHSHNTKIIDSKSLNRYSLLNMASQMEKVYTI